MATIELVGNIQTVTGLIAPEVLGPTLMHEHILWDVTRPEVVRDTAQNNSPEITITLQNVWEVNRRSILDYGNQSNRKYSVALEELSILRRNCENVAIVDSEAGWLRHAMGCAADEVAKNDLVHVMVVGALKLAAVVTLFEPWQIGPTFSRSCIQNGYAIISRIGDVEEIGGVINFHMRHNVGNALDVPLDKA